MSYFWIPLGALYEYTIVPCSYLHFCVRYRAYLQTTMPTNGRHRFSCCPRSWNVKMSLFISSSKFILSLGKWNTLRKIYKICHFWYNQMISKLITVLFTQYFSTASHKIFQSWASVGEINLNYKVGRNSKIKINS